jgi:hypothetical protein
MGCAAWLCLLILAFSLTHALWDKKELSELGGVLLPANDPDPSGACNAKDTALKLFFGPQTIIADAQSLSIIKVHDRELIGIERDANDKVVLNADIRNSDGKVVALVSRNVFHVNRNNIIDSLFSRSRDRSTITLTDEFGNRLKIRYLNKHSMEFSGRLFYSPQEYIDITDRGLTLMPRNLTLMQGPMCFEIVHNATLLGID